MAELEPLFNASEIGEEFMQEFLPAILERFSPLITILKAVGIVLIVYFLFLILKTLFTWRAAAKVRRIAKNVEELNMKMDILISKHEAKEKKEKPVVEEKPKKQLLKKKKVKGKKK